MNGIEISTWLSGGVKALALTMSFIALSAVAGPCSTSYNFMKKEEANAIHLELRKEASSIDKRLGIINSKQEAMHEDLKTLLNHMLRSKKHDH